MKKSYVNEDIYKDIVSSTNMVSGEEFRTIICTIAQLCSDMVVKTLGPYGATTLMDDGAGFIYPTKDGWSALRKLRFNDPLYNTALNLLRQTSFNAVNSVGDGTTTAMVASNAFLQYIMNQDLDNHDSFNQALFRSTIEQYAEDLIKELHSYTTHITRDENGYEIIRRIATIATNGNEAYGNLIADIYRKTDNPNIHVQTSNDDSVSVEYQEGYKVEALPLFFRAYTNTDEGHCIKKNAKLAIFNHNVTYVGHYKLLSSIVTMANHSNYDIIVMAPYFDDIICKWIGDAAQRASQEGKQIPLLLVQLPMTTELQRLALEDLEIMTNGAIFTDSKCRMYETMVTKITSPESIVDEALLKIAQDSYSAPDEIITTSLGTVANMEIAPKECFLRDFEKTANKDALKKAREIATETWETLRKKSNKAINASLDKEYLSAHQRYIRLIGKMGIIKVGGASELQRICDKDAFDDACLACRSAWDHGYICGMGADTMRAIKTLDKKNPPTRKSDDRYRRIASTAIYQAFNEVMLAILRNMCSDSVKRDLNVVKKDMNSSLIDQTNEDIVNQITDITYFDLESNPMDRVSFDIRTGTFYPMWHEKAIINSVDVDEQIIRAMVSVLTMVITSSQFLSTARMYDRKMTRSQEIQQKATDKMIEGRAWMNGVLGALSSSSASNQIQKIVDIITDGIIGVPAEEIPEKEESSVNHENGEDITDFIHKMREKMYSTNGELMPESVITSNSADYTTPPGCSYNLTWKDNIIFPDQESE